MQLQGPYIICRLEISNKYITDIEEEITAGKERIEKYQQQLSKAKQIKSHKQQYDAIAQLIKQYPSKEETTSAISRVS